MKFAMRALLSLFVLVASFLTSFFCVFWLAELLMECDLPESISGALLVSVGVGFAASLGALLAFLFSWIENAE